MKLLLFFSLVCLSLSEYYAGQIRCDSTAALNRRIPDPASPLETVIRYNTSVVQEVGVWLYTAALVYNIEPLNDTDIAYCDTIRTFNNVYNVSYMVGANYYPTKDQNVGMRESIYIGVSQIGDVTELATAVWSGNYLMRARVDEYPLVYEEVLTLFHPEDGPPRCYFFYSLYSCWVQDWLVWAIIGGVSLIGLCVVACLCVCFVVIMAIIIRACCCQDCGGDDEY